MNRLRRGLLGIVGFAALAVSGAALADTWLSYCAGNTCVHCNLETGFCVSCNLDTGSCEVLTSGGPIGP